jgi:hypothetical protein
VDRDDLIGVTELASYVDRRVPELSYEAFKIRQVPQMKIVGSNLSDRPPGRGAGDRRRRATGSNPHQGNPCCESRPPRCMRPQARLRPVSSSSVPGRKYGWAADSFSPPVRGLGIVEIVPNYAGAELSCHLSN